MKKYLPLILILALLLTACGAEKPVETEPAPAETEAPAAEAEPVEETVTHLPEFGEDENSMSFSAVNADSYGYFHFLCQTTGIYDFTVKNCEPADWSIYLLDEEFLEAERYIPQAYQALLTGEGTVKLYEGLWVYIYCPFNDWTCEEAPEGASCTLCLDPDKTEEDVTLPVELPEGFVITKDPTGETVLEGETTWFIARADNAESMLWEFLDTEGGVHSVEETQQLHRGLILTVTEDTIQLEYIPRSLDGWSCHAVFFSGGASLTGAAAEIAVNADRPYYYSFYESVFTAYDTLLKGGEDELGLFTDMGLKREDLYYALYDVNGDRTPELFVACPYAAEDPLWNSVIYSAFTLQRGEPVKLLVSMARSRYMFSSVFGFIHEGSGGASSSFCYAEDMIGGALSVREGIYTEDGVFYYVSGGDAESGTSAEISSEEYSAWQTGYEGVLATLPFVPMFE